MLSSASFVDCRWSVAHTCATDHRQLTTLAIPLAAARAVAVAVAARRAIAARAIPATAIAQAAAGAGRAAVLGRLAGQYRTARQADPAGARLDADHHDIDLVAHLDHVLDVLDPLGVQLRDVDHAVLAGHQVDEGAKRHDSHHLAQEHIADLDLARQRLDHRHGLLGRLAVGGGHEHPAIVLDVDLRAGRLGDAADGLAAGPDQRADLLGVDLQRDDPRRERRQLLTRLRNSGIHLVQNVQPALARLGERLAHDLVGDPGGLDIHLQASDPLRGAGDLEVHVAQVILDALDIGQ